MTIKIRNTDILDTSAAEKFINGVLSGHALIRVKIVHLEYKPIFYMDFY